jgi:hypothetical protein
MIAVETISQRDFIFWLTKSFLVLAVRIATRQKVLRLIDMDECWRCKKIGPDVVHRYSDHLCYGTFTCVTGRLCNGCFVMVQKENRMKGQHFKPLLKMVEENSGIKYSDAMKLYDV